jgi:hypothetical protein
MNLLQSLGALFLALSFCGLSERLQGLSGSSNSGTKSPASNTSSNSTTKTEKASLTASQQAIVDSATETAWADQGLSWKLPAGWKKMDVKKESFNYQSPDNAFLLVNISVMPDSFPMDASLNAYHEQALQQLKHGKYEAVKMVEIDGIPGVEFVEAMPEDKSGPRRHQWIGYRDYLGQKQQLNVMTSTKGTNFEKHTDNFQAILYSMKATK